METKLRAWSNGQMMYKTAFDLNWYATETNTETGCNTLRKMKPDDRSLKIMQCTGLKDKNGKFIYEGDILSEKIEVDGQMKDSAIPVLWSIPSAMWVVDLSFRKNGDYVEPLHEYYRTTEIIGNVIQNPDLINEAV